MTVENVMRDKVRRDKVREQLSRFLGDVVAGWKISEAFEKLGIDESGKSEEGYTKWRRIHETFSDYDLPWIREGEEDGYWLPEAKRLIQYLFDPIDYSNDPDRFEALRAELNGILKWIGLAYTSDAEFVSIGEQNTVRQNADSGNDFVKESELAPDARKVFVIHGRDNQARRSMYQYLRALGLEPIEWTKARQMTGKPTPDIREIVGAGFSNAQALIALFTPDDETRLKLELQGSDEPPYETELTGQPRPNVIYETGAALSQYPDRTIIVEIGKLRPFSDLDGLHTVRVTNDSLAWRKDLAERLKSVGCDVDMDGNDWLTEGRFDIQ